MKKYVQIDLLVKLGRVERRIKKHTYYLQELSRSVIQKDVFFFSQKSDILIQILWGFVFRTAHGKSNLQSSLAVEKEKTQGN